MDVQARVRLAGLLYRAALRDAAAKLGGAPTAEEKMALHARVEEAAWALPDEEAAAVADLDADDPLPDRPSLRRVVDEAVAALMAGRPR